MWFEKDQRNRRPVVAEYTALHADLSTTMESMPILQRVTKRFRSFKPLAFLFAASAVVFVLTVTYLALEFSRSSRIASPVSFGCPGVLPTNSSDYPIMTSHNGTTMPLRMVTYNIRYANDKPVADEKLWDERCPRLINQLRFIAAGQESPFIVMQEVLDRQIHDIQHRLGAPWDHIGRGRGKGETDGEFSPIFYRSDVWALSRYETRWLSETPDRPSRGWDARFNRIVTMGEFTHRKTNTTVVVMSTHFDHVGAKAREHSAELLIQFAKEWSHAGEKSPSVTLIGGDFNSSPDDGSYHKMTEPGSGMSDIRDLVPEHQRYGNNMTYTSFGEGLPGYEPSRIDFLFIQEPRTAVVTNFGVLANQFDDGVLISDHRPVVADMEIVP